jgi:hypothetical protein
MESKKFLNADEVAAEFGLDAATLQQFVESGEIRALADRGTWKYRRDELQALLTSGMIQPPSASEDGQILTFHNPDDDVSYIELDEDALAEQATMITKSSPAAPEAPAAPTAEPAWFVPSDEPEMSAAAEQSSNDSAIDSPRIADTELSPETLSAEVPSEFARRDDPPTEETSSIADASDSDVKIASEYETSRPEDSGILLDFNLDAGATVSSSGSSLRLPQSVPDDVEGAPESAEADDSAWDDLTASSGEESSVVAIAGDADNIHSGEASAADDSAVQWVGMTDSSVKLPMEESGILVDEGSQVGMTGGSSVLAGSASGVIADSGISLDFTQDDSGIALDDGRSATDDSGIALSAGDSGISLEGPDSGLSLTAAESGISLGSIDESGISIGNARTMADHDLDADRTQTLDLSNESDDSAFDINLHDADATAELFLGDDDDADDTSATVVRKGRPAQGSLSAAFELDDGAEVEDLEISEHLDADIDAVLSDDDVDADDEEVFEASDDTFSGEEVEAIDDDEYLEPEAKSKKPAGPREPAWGTGMAIGLVACTLFLVANTVILWTGVSTMWNGADAEGPGGTLVQTFGGLLGN